jgi:hypothetical protein
MYIPPNWGFGSAFSKLWNGGFEPHKLPLFGTPLVEAGGNSCHVLTKI